MKSTRTLVLSILGVMVAFGAAAVLSSRSSEVSVSAPAETIESVIVVRAHREDLTRTLTLPGDIKPLQEVSVHAKVSGYLKAIHVDRGDWVKAHEPLAQLEIPEMDREYHRLESDMIMKRRIYQRLADIHRENPDLIPLEEVELGQTEFEMAKDSLDELSIMMAYATIRAPFDGVVTTRYVHPGALIQAGTTSQANGTPLVTIMDLDRVRIIVAIPESDVAWITQTTPVSITVDAWSGKEWTGRVTRYAHALNPDTRTMPTEIEVSNPDHVLYPGMYAHVTFTLQTMDNRLVLPRQAVLKTPTTRELLVVDNERVKAVVVQTGYEDERWVEITEGLTGEERIILQDHQRIRPGDRVTVREGTN